MALCNNYLIPMIIHASYEFDTTDVQTIPEVPEPFYSLHASFVH